MANPFYIQPALATQGAMQGLGSLAQAGGQYFANERAQDQNTQNVQQFMTLVGQAEASQNPEEKKRLMIQAFTQFPEQAKQLRQQSAYAMEQQQLEQIGKPEAITPYQQEQIDINKAKIEQRKLENQTRKLEQALKREDNKLKREELQLKIDERKSRLKQAQTDIQEGLESDLSTIDNTLNTIAELKTGGGLEAAVGTSSLLPTIAGSKAADFEARLEQLKSQQFLNEVGRLKGMGALSENEGKKLAAAASALELSMSEDEFKRELDYIESTMANARDKIAGKLPKTTQVVNWSDM